MYGYNQQIVDIIGLEIIKEQTNKPVCVDITHSLQFRNEGALHQAEEENML